MRYCARCVYPEIAVNTLFDDEGICGACRVQEEFDQLDEGFWARRRDVFAEIVEGARDPEAGRYDCVIPVSGGKDSYCQTARHQEELRAEPAAGHLPRQQLHARGRAQPRPDARGRSASTTSSSARASTLLTKMNRLGFRKMGDMNWHAHCGIITVPIQVAVRYKVPLVIWGEHGFIDSPACSRSTTTSSSATATGSSTTCAATTGTT